MKRAPFLLLGSLLAGGLLSQVSSQAAEGRTAVLLELFTSEGCSSCPSADQLLAKLDRMQPVPDVDLVVLSEHVDYWNHDGWVDPFSSAASSERQQHFAAQLHNDDIYTPQLVIDGRSQLVGSDWPKAKAAIEVARRSQKLKIHLENKLVESKKTLLLNVSPEAGVPAGDVYVALAADTVDMQVKAGENSGRHLAHTAAVYSLIKVGKTSAASAFTKSIELPDHPKWGAATCTVVFVQDPRSGKILGVSQAPTPL